MDFWRSGQARSYRDQSAQRKGMGWWQRLTGFHFPAWVPVAFISVVVLGILGGLFLVQSAKAAPRIGDHWHIVYTVFIGGERQQQVAAFEAGAGSPGTHGDGVMHSHPFAPQGEGAGSSLRNFFFEGGGKLSGDELQIPGRRETYKNGDLIPDTDQPGEVRILRADSDIHPLGGDFDRAIQTCDSKPESEYEEVSPRYVPQDGECIRIVFGPPEVEVVVQPDRTLIPADQATRTVELEVTGAGEGSSFSPSSVDLSANEVVKVVLRNKSEPELGADGNPTGGPYHGLRFNGPDGEYGTSDDYVSEPPTLHPGEEGVAVVRFETAGTFEFRDEASAAEGATPVTGTVSVSAPAATPASGETPTPVPADVSLDASATDSTFEPSTLVVEAGKRFRIRVANNGSFIHNLRIAGPDGEYQTEDDIATETYINPGGQGEVSGQIDGPGEYAFRCDFHPTVHAGTIRVQ